MPSGQDITSATLYTVFTGKADLMAALVQVIDGAEPVSRLTEILYRLSNTDTDNWGSGGSDDHDARHDD